MRRAVLAVAVMVVLPGVAASPAGAEQTVSAGPRDRFTTPQVTIAQGETLVFANLDVDQHNVVATRKDATGTPLFASRTIGANESAPVEGVKYLTTGSYDFLCTIHPFMTGTLTVSSQGAPVPRPDGKPPPLADARPPDLRLGVRPARLSTVRRTRRISVRVAADEAADVVLVARVGSRVVGRAAAPVTAARAANVAIALTRRLPAGDRVRITVRGEATDAAGNVGAVGVSRLLSR